MAGGTKKREMVRYGEASSSHVLKTRSKTYNRFAVLNENLDIEQTEAVQDIEPNIQKPPPIVLHENYGMQKILKLCGDEYSFKKTSIGIKVLSPSQEKYDEIIKKLKDNRLCFHTHRMRDRGVFKMIISGLPKWPVNLIEESLEKQGIVFESVEEVITKRSTIDDSLYLVKFKRSKTSKKVLFQKVRFINQVAITWKNGYAKKKGPTQCENCAMYGHGAENCHRLKMCIRCSSEHLTNECQINNFKCGHCMAKKYVDTNHRADDPRCPCREDYLLARNRALNKNRQQTRRQPTYDYKERDFPLPPRTTRFEDKPTPERNEKRTYSEQLRAEPSTSQEMFSLDQLFSIFQEATADLKKCTSKLEQLNVIMGLLKYAI
jgi:hypothetical protein